MKLTEPLHYLRKQSNTINLLKHRKSGTHKKSPKILCNLRYIFLAQHFVFHPCAIFNERDFFYNHGQNIRESSSFHEKYRTTGKF